MTTANVVVATRSGDGNTPLDGLGWAPFSNLSVGLVFPAPKQVLVVGLNGNSSHPMEGWGFNFSNASVGEIFAVQRQTFLGALDFGQGFIFVTMSPTIAPVAPRNTTFPFAQ